MLYLRMISVFLFVLCVPSDARGLLYEYFSDGYFTSIHLLIVNPNEHRIFPVKAEGEDIRRETVATLANRYGAIAAINGGFWEENGDPAGVLKIDGQWLGTQTLPRGALGWSESHRKVLIDRILTNHSLKEDASGSQIEAIPASNSPHTTSEEWKQVEHIVGGRPVLIQGGELIQDFSQERTRESFLMNKHPRTAVGIRENGDWIFVVVDGRFYGIFGGMTIAELAQFMRDIGCVEALNLDGGGSSTLFLRGHVISIPCGEIEEEGKRVRAVSDAILIL